MLLFMIWTSSQRRALLVMVGAVGILLVYTAAVNRRFVEDPQPIESPLMNELADRIDPNVASFEELVVLPQMGERRAREVIAYREEFLRTHPAGRAFAVEKDLLNVKGIGAGMMGTLSPHLVFPATQPADQEK